MCLFSISLVIPPCDSPAVTFLFIVVYRFWSCDLLRREIILSEKARSCFPCFLELTARVDSHVIIVSDYFPVWSFYVISIFKAPNTYNSSKTTSHQNCFKNLIFAPHGRVNDEYCFWCMSWTKLTYSQHHGQIWFFSFHLVSMAPNVKCVQPGGVTTREMSQNIILFKNSFNLYYIVTVFSNKWNNRLSMKEFA